MNRVKILVADDHDLMRRGIRALLSGNPRWNVCGEARDGREAVIKCQQWKPDIAILDFHMPELNGLEAARQIRSVSPQTQLLMLTIDSSNQLVHAMSAIGVRGYVLKGDCGLELVRALEALESHQPYFTNYAVEIMLTKTADTHRANLMRKLELHSITELVRYALRNHVVDP